MIKNTIWALKIALKNSPGPLIAYFIIRIAGESLSVILAGILANIIDSVTASLGTAGSVYDYVGIVFLWIACLFISYIVMMVKWRISERLIPLYASLKYDTVIFKMYQNVPYKFLSQREFLKEFDVATDGIRNINQYIVNIIQIFALVYHFVLTNIVLFCVHPIFCVITLIAFVIAMLIEASTKKISFDLYQKVGDSTAISAYYETVLIGREYAKETRLLGTNDFFLEKWKKQYDEVTDLSIKASRKIDWKFSAYEFLCNIVAIGALILGLLMASRGLVTAGSIVLIWNTMNNTLTNVQGLQRSAYSFTSTGAKLAFSRTFYEKYGQKAETAVQNDEAERDAVYPVSLRNVSFSYRDGHEVLHHIDLDIRKGQVIALCGDNGSGKSTLVKLILGLLTPDEGVVKVWGREDIAGKSYQENNTAAIFQDFVKYPLTLRENVGFGNLSEMENDDKVISALAMADGNGILSKAGGLDQVLSREMEDTGTELSGGEWQRVALARIFMGNEDLMIFDEPAAALDPISEKNQFDMIRRELNGKTGILISHRIGFASMADRIIVLENGRIVEDGSHEALMGLKGKYYALFRSQADWYESV